MTVPNPRSPTLAALLSAILWPGLGQLYNGRLGRFLLVQLALPVGCTAAFLAVLRVGPTARLVAGVQGQPLLGLPAGDRAHRTHRRRLHLDRAVEDGG